VCTENHFDSKNLYPIKTLLFSERFTCSMLLEMPINLPADRYILVTKFNIKTCKYHDVILLDWRFCQTVMTNLQVNG